MKKILALSLTILMVLSLCACGAPKTFEAAVEKAEKKIEEWNSVNYNTYGYTSVYPENGKSFTVIMIPQLIDSNPGMYTKDMAKVAAKGVYKDIAKCFSAVDTTVVIAVMTRKGDILYMFNSEDFK